MSFSYYTIHQTSKPDIQLLYMYTHFSSVLFIKAMKGRKTKPSIQILLKQIKAYLYWGDESHKMSINKTHRILKYWFTTLVRVLIIQLSRRVFPIFSIPFPSIHYHFKTKTKQNPVQISIAHHNKRKISRREEEKKKQTQL